MDKLDIIIGQLAELKTIQRDDVKGIHAKIDKLFSEGCAKAGQHDDMEARMRSVETNLSRASGAMAAIIAVSGMIGAVAGWLTSHFKGGNGG